MRGINGFFCPWKEQGDFAAAPYFGSRLLLQGNTGFYACIFTSGSRTAIYVSAAIMIVALRNVQLYLRSNPGKVSKIILFAYFAVNIFLNISSSATGAGGI